MRLSANRCLVRPPPPEPQPETRSAPPTPGEAASQSGPEISFARRRELILLNRVQRFWISNVLEESTSKATEITLTAQDAPAALAQRWPELAPPPADSPAYTLSDDQLVALFRQADASLLILGQAGAGKTFTMLRLVRGLLQRAAAEPALPIPVVFNLSTWAEQRGSISSWLLEELTTKYQIPKTIGREWLAADRLSLFLDGLDVVPKQALNQCLAAINEFRHEFGFCGVAVACRSEAYFAAAVRLNFVQAIQLNPVEPAAASQFLRHAGLDQSLLEQQLAHNPTLVELIRSPLALRAVASIYQEQVDTFSLPSQDGFTDADSYLSSLISRYVAEMLNRPAGDNHYPADHLKQWLGWLAARMSEHNQTELYIENLQPSWLPSRGWRWFYMVTTRLADGLVIGLIMWLLLYHLRLVHPDLPLGLTQPFSFIREINFIDQDGSWLLAVNILLGLLVALIQIIHYEQDPFGQRFNLTARQHHYANILVVGLIVFLVTFLTSFRLGEPIPMLFWALNEAILSSCYLAVLCMATVIGPRSATPSPSTGPGAGSRSAWRLASCWPP